MVIDMKFNWIYNGVSIELENGRRYFLEYNRLLVKESKSAQTKKTLLEGVYSINDLEKFIENVEKHLNFLLKMSEYISNNSEYAKNHEKAINNRLLKVIECEISEEDAEKEIKRIVEREKRERLTEMEMRDKVRSVMNGDDIRYIKKEIENAKIFIVREYRWGNDEIYKIIIIKDGEIVGKQVKSIRTVYNILFNNKINVNRLEDLNVEDMTEGEMMYLKAMFFDEPEENRKLLNKFLVLSKL